jgi:hypothetical protein
MGARTQVNVMVIAAALAAVLLSGCGSDVTSWSEDVQLADGKVIRLERRATRGATGFPTAHRGSVSSWELCYAPKRIYWQSAHFEPMEFQMVGESAYVKVFLSSCSKCKIAGRPPDSTLYLALRGGQWVRIQSSEFPESAWINLATSGLFNERDPALDIKGHLDLESKREREPQGSREQGLAIAQRSFCQRECGHQVETDLVFDFKAKPSGSFCR